MLQWSTLKNGGVSGGVGDMFRSSGGLKSRGHFTAINKDPDPLPHQPHPEDPKWEKTEESWFSNWLQGLRQPTVRCSRSQSLPVSLSMRLQQVLRLSTLEYKPESAEILDLKITQDALPCIFTFLVFSHICNENRKEQMNFIQKGDCYDISENQIPHTVGRGL